VQTESSVTLPAGRQAASLRKRQQKLAVAYWPAQPLALLEKHRLKHYKAGKNSSQEI
jgi:hypothetical protein